MLNLFSVWGEGEGTALVECFCDEEHLPSQKRRF